jgi:gamma-glutamyltranspeptidase / glutathione hydrolase
MPARRRTLYGNRHAISAGHYLAAATGFAIREAGGNAVDAGCCADDFPTRSGTGRGRGGT